ncbi:MAG: VWA domain-containing protein [Erysipelotrichaceae bacterium]|nr:VWA domain-containing protein [Erysipelotrichaceae bacterium]
MIRKILLKLCSSFLAIAMVVGLLSTGISSNVVYAEGDVDTPETTTSGIELTKTATLEDDGTYTIDLEAYATGTTTTTTTTSSVPLDIVLVVDQSGSMTDTISSTSTSYEALQEQSYTYSSYGSKSYYYLAEDGNYYKVSRKNDGGYGILNDPKCYLYYTDNNNVTYYLSGTTVTTIKPDGVNSQTETIWTGVLYSVTTTTTSTTKLVALQTAVTNFVGTIQDNAEKYSVDHRIAIVGFASNNSDGTSGSSSKYSISSGSSSSYWVNTGLFINGSLTNYGSSSSNTNTQLTSDDYKKALVSVNDNGSVASSITEAISNFAASGTTRTQYGLEMANQVFYNNPIEEGSNRQRIVVVFTDGQPGQNSSNFSTDNANSTISKANTAKNTYNATVYSIGLYTSTQSDNVTNFMNYISSNYPNATSMTAAGTKADTKYYMTASNATELNNVFSTITTDATSSSTFVTLAANSVMKDIMGDGFTLTSDSEVTVATYSGTADSDGNITFDMDQATTTSNACTVTKDIESNTVSVIGFNYADKYISSGHQGEKICVTIKGVLPTESVTTGEAVNTNAATSGIYATADATEATATFKQPQTIITKKLYVIDYAKDTDLCDTNLDEGDALDQDASITAIATKFEDVSDNDNELTLNYGYVLNDSYDSKVSVVYRPKTMQWNGYDSFYVFGQTTNEEFMSYTTNTNARVAEGDNDTANLWSKVSVIPANNVYYEDDFITTTSDSSESTNKVGIVYSGNDWTTDGSALSNDAIANSGVYGWETSLSDDATYSDGTAHTSSTDGATATFTFTGTGVDIYSRTTMSTGTVYAKLTGNTEYGTSVTKRLIVDNLAVSNNETGYYQIPTVSFEDLKYGTYTVTLTVTSQAEGRSTYYLDGIRVYNPLGTVTEEDGDAYEAYAGDNELNAVFTEVRDLLLTDETFTADYDGTRAVVFIDKNTYNGDGETNNSTSIVGTYVDLGPKNEVYLKKGQSIAFKVDADYGTDVHYYIGLKALNGATTAKVTDGTSEMKTLTISGASDLYYEITPYETVFGKLYIMIENTTDNLLSVTKLRTTATTIYEDSTSSTDSGTNSAIVLLSADDVNDILAYANTFNSLTTVDYVDDEYSDTEITEDDIVIENPEVDDTEDNEEVEDTTTNESQSVFGGIINSIRNWFSSWR